MSVKDDLRGVNEYACAQPSVNLAFRCQVVFKPSCVEFGHSVVVPRTMNGLVALFLITTSFWHPQSSSSLGVSGTVFDPSGAVIAGAKVTLRADAGQVVADAGTDDAGVFRLERVPAGSYTVTVSAAGFREVTIRVKTGKAGASPLRITLPIATQSDTVTIAGGDSTAEVSTDIAQNQSANTVDRDALDRVPVLDQDYITTLSRFLDDSALGTNGVTLVVNGVEANGPGVTPSAIQEVKINQNPYSALFSRPGRARLEIVTKGGTPAFHGTVNFLFRDAALDARNAIAVTRPPERRQFYEGSLTGPLSASGKTTFLLSLDEDLDDQQATVDAQTPPEAVHENVSTPMHHFFGSGRVFHDFPSGDQFWIGYSYEHRSARNQGVGGTVLPEAGYDIRFLEHEVNVSYRHIISPHWVNSLRFLVGHFDAPTISLNAAPQMVVSGEFTSGGAQADARRTEYHADGNDTVTYSSGRHTVNFGVDVPDLSRRGADDFTNAAGTYTFASLADFEAVTPKPATFLQQRGNGHLTFFEATIAGFVEDNIRVRPNFSLSVGVRYYWQNFFREGAHNFAPRLGFAFAPRKKGKTVIRGGAGIFYDRTGPRPIADLLHFNGVNLLRFVLTNPPFPVTPGDLAGVPTSLVLLDSRLRIPYTLQYSIGVERQVTKKSTFSATYVGSRGIDLFRSTDANAPLPGSLVRPNPAIGQERRMESESYLKGNALELTFRGAPSKLFSGQVQYTLSKTYNNTSGITYFPGNSLNPAADWARSDNDRRHKFDLLGSMHPSKLFSLGVALSLYSGRPVNVTTGGDQNGDGITNDRPLVGTGAALLARNTLHGPGMANLDINLAHDFVLSKKQKEHRTLTVAVNSFNVLNHRNDTTYLGVCGAATITAAGCPATFFGHAVSALPARRMQLNLEFKF